MLEHTKPLDKSTGLRVTNVLNTDGRVFTSFSTGASIETVRVAGKKRRDQDGIQYEQ